jgi:hypothetical protein
VWRVMTKRAMRQTTLLNLCWRFTGDKLEWWVAYRASRKLSSRTTKGLSNQRTESILGSISCGPWIISWHAAWPVL